MGLVDMLNDSEYMRSYVRTIKVCHRSIPQSFYRKLPKDILERLRREFMKPIRFDLKTQELIAYINLKEMPTDSEFMYLYLRLVKTLPTDILERLREKWIKPRKMDLNTSNV